MSEKFQNYINGEWVDAVSGETFENRNPANWDEIVGIFPSSDERDVARAVEAAKNAQKIWAELTVTDRAKILGKAGDIMVEKKEEISRLMTREMGKILKETRGDTQEGIDTAFYAYGEARRLYGITTPSELNDKIAYTTVKPIGVAGLITPWNFPMAIPCWKSFPALLVGNSVVFKPASDTPATATMLIRIFEDAGMPKGVVNLVHGTGGKVGEAIIKHPDIGVISFTGSSAVGSRIAEVAGKSLKRVSLELGGKNPQIVMDDADLELALEGALWGAFGTTGQRCTATSRLILHEPIYNKFIEMLMERAKQLQLGNGLDESTDIGPVINEAQMTKIMNYIEIGKNEGARLVLGGKRYVEGECAKGWFIEPTIFIDVNPQMRIAQEEIFGPVLSILKAKDFDEAVGIANNVVYGLSSSIYTTNLRNAMKAVEKLEAGITYVNAPTIGAECHLPFGGVKNTGNGHREGGRWAYEIFSEIKTVYIDYSGKLQKAQIDVDTNK
ncbi:MAG TPA: aldehyde dehydrogenase family protein [candidate division WOR-3 bacterium]|uniref:Aldehyde dehydrogenase family protein n=1 Tax=candidate division WOR-3 bacterium TaxID=2052148 RepID=A0A7C5DHD7_UNCW3|nr:aldehyde dehydrogenase family protein [candidate division WOR-3 bacterium]